MDCIHNKDEQEHCEQCNCDKPQHTAGPWHVDNFDKAGICSIKSSDGIVVAHPHGPSGEWCKVKEEHRANAQLIACAPELLERLKTCERYIANSDGENNPIALNIRCLISKAEGRSL